MCGDVLLGVGGIISFQGIEGIFCAQNLLYSLTEALPHGSLPCLLAGCVVAGIHGQHKEEVHVVVAQQQRVAVEQSVAEL